MARYLLLTLREFGHPPGFPFSNTLGPGKLLLNMRNAEQFQVWVLDDGRWQIIGAFPDFDPANALARARNSRVRLVRAEFDTEKQIVHDVLAEIGATKSI